MAEQQIQLTDLSTQQLQEIKTQLQEVSKSSPTHSDLSIRRKGFWHVGFTDILLSPHPCAFFVRPSIQEIEHLTSSFGSLKGAQGKYKSCLSDITEIKSSHAGTSQVSYLFRLISSHMQTKPVRMMVHTLEQ